MALDTDSPLGTVALSIELLGGRPPYTGSIAGSPNDFGGCLDIVPVSDEVLNLILNESGVGNLPSNPPPTGQVTVKDAVGHSVTFEPFAVPMAPTSIVTIPPPAPQPTTGSFYDNAALGTIVIRLSSVGGSDPFVFWSIVSGFDDGTGNSFLDIQPDGSMPLNSFGTTYYAAHPGNGTLTGFVQVTDSNGNSPPSPTQITLTVVAHPADPSAIATVSLVHSIA